MKDKIYVLLVEDSEDDATLALRMLQRGGFDVQHARVDSAAAMEAALRNESWDAVISDFNMPGFSGLDALRILRSADIDIPFLLVSGKLGEDTAVGAMKAGASDYIMKQNLARLAPALERELKEAAMRAEYRRAQGELAANEQRYRQLVHALPAAVYTCDAQGRVTLYNEAAAELWGREPEIGKELWCGSWRIYEPDGRPLPLEQCPMALAMQQGRPILGREIVIERPDGTRRTVLPHPQPMFDASGVMVGAVDMLVDITERKQAEGKIRRLNRVYAVLSGINTLIVHTRSRDELFREACRIAVDDGQFKMAWIGIVDRNAMMIAPVASAGVDAEFLALITDRFSLLKESPMGNTLSARAVRERTAMVSNHMQGDSRILFQNERTERGIAAMAVLPLVIANDAVGVLALYADEANFFDAEELKLLTELADDVAYAMEHIDTQDRLDYLAYYDALTGLANQTLFLDRTAQYMRSAAGGGHKLALFLVDLERFKNINDSLGQAAGDELLRQVAEWLMRNAGEANLLARVGADHFAVLLPKLAPEDDAAKLLERVMDAFLDHPFRLNSAMFRIAVKVGAALYPDDGADAGTLFRNAEAALKNAKAHGDRYLFHTQKMTDAVAGKLTLENQLRLALDNGEFVLHYQPKINLASGKLTGAEVLIRWNDPQTGLVPPGRFIPVLEETGLIHDVGRWALRQAISDFLRWRAAGLAPVRISVNVSPLQLRHRGFIADVRQVVGIDANAAAGLELELTESLIMEDIRHSIASLQVIRAMGVSVAIDDFGTGFSSLSYLSRLPVDTLKIDRSFVVDMTASSEGLALVSTIINLAHALKLNVVAEGVETEEQSRLLRLLKCDEMQGYFFSRAVPAEIFESKFLALPAKGDD